MALTKQPVPINFIKGLDTKTDPFQVQLGNFEALNNTVFDTLNRLTKRNGNANITNLPVQGQTTLTTLSDNLIATGSNLYAFSQDTDQWIEKGIVQPIALSTQPLVRVATSQTSTDAAVAPNGLTCLTYIDTGLAYYQISDSSTGQQIVSRTALPASATNPRSFLLGRYFIITFLSTISGTPHLQYIAIPVANPNAPETPQDISTTVLNATTAGYDAVVANDIMYFGWAGSAGDVKLTFLTQQLVVGAAVSLAGHTANLMSLTADLSATSAVIWATFWDSSSTNGFTTARDHTLAPILPPTQVITTQNLQVLTSTASNGVMLMFTDIINDYASPYPVGSVRSDFIISRSVTVTGTVGTAEIILRSVGLASKAFISSSGLTYMLVAYGEMNQPSYFLMDQNGALYMRLAYSNGGGYEINQVLPNVSLVGDTYYTPYLIKDFLTTINKGTDLPAGTPTSAIYTQTGINLALFQINTSGQHSSEIAGALHLTGGQLWEYDGVRPVELGFQVWPENIAFTTATTGGNISRQLYNYVFTYEWTDNAGNLHRSAPSIPLVVDLTSSGTDTNVNTLYVPTLRLTYKVAPNPVRIVGYRWSVAQQVFYQFTSVTSFIANNPAIDFMVIADTLSDASILGNAILYTTGGVVENIAPPASVASVLYKNRLFLIDAEDPNLLWFSKQVIETTPVEMSDLFTIYVAPTTGAQQSTGPMTALSAMDDKLIIFKKDAAYYLTGTGPDNTGSQNDFSDPIYITSSVGCANQNSIVLMPTGIMFQSDKGIWILGRDLSTNYIGAPVEKYNSNTVMSASAIPGTNQVRFVLDNNITLMYDYYTGQWGTFSNIFAISACLYQSKHTYLNSFGKVFQETPGLYLDGSTPVLMSFTTSWINVAGLQGYERFYFAYLLGTYFTPFTLDVQIGYDYNASADQAITIRPDNYAAPWGNEAVWGGGGNWGGPGNVFSARFFPAKQKCESFQLTINEIYDSSLGVPSGQGLTLSGLNMVIGVKKGYRTQKAARSFG